MCVGLGGLRNGGEGSVFNCLSQLVSAHRSLFPLYCSLAVGRGLGFRVDYCDLIVSLLGNWTERLDRRMMTDTVLDLKLVSVSAYASDLRACFC